MGTGIITELANFISNCGFPIIVVWYLWKNSKDQQKTFAEAIKNNTEAIKLLTRKVDQLVVIQKAHDIVTRRGDRKDDE